MEFLRSCPIPRFARASVLFAVATAACGGVTNTAPRDAGADGTALPADGALDRRDSAGGSDGASPPSDAAIEGATMSTADAADSDAGSAPGDAAIEDAPMSTADVGPCDPTKPEPVVLGGGSVSPITGLAIDEGFVYFATDPIGVARVPKNGGTVEQPPAGDGGAGQWSLAPAADIATAGGFVYWAPAAVGVARVPTADFANTVPSLIASSPLGFQGGRTVAVDDTSAYVADLTGGIWSVPQAGGSLALVAKTEAGVNGVVVLAADSSGLYWTDARNGVFRAAPDGGAPILLVAGYANSLALDSTSVYAPILLGAGDGSATVSIVQVPKAGGPTTALASTSGSTGGIAVDDAYVYWTDDAMPVSYDKSGTLRKVPKAGGPATAITSTQWVPDAIAVDGACVYYGDVGLVKRVPK
jgi:hypothetical protein